MSITIKNDFHGTEARLKANIGDELTPAQINRAKIKLCGIAGCTCSGDAGERGPQDGFTLVPAHQNTILVLGK